jgi:hypothetical protein
MTSTNILPEKEVTLYSLISLKRQKEIAKAKGEVEKTNTTPKLTQKTMRRQKTLVQVLTMLDPLKMMTSLELSKKRRKNRTIQQNHAH